MTFVHFFLCCLALFCSWCFFFFGVCILTLEQKYFFIKKRKVFRLFVTLFRCSWLWRWVYFDAFLGFNGCLDVYLCSRWKWVLTLCQLLVFTTCQCLHIGPDCCHDKLLVSCNAAFCVIRIIWGDFSNNFPDLMVWTHVLQYKLNAFCGMKQRTRW